MKYFKVLSVLIFLNVSAFAYPAYLLSDRNYCVDEYYYSYNKFYFLKSNNQTWYSVTTLGEGDTIIDGYDFDSNTSTCRPASLIYGMEVTQFYFLMGLIGVIFGAVFMFFTAQIFIMVGGRR